MKKLLILFLALFLLSSCGKAPAEQPEPYLRYPMSAEAHLSCEAGNARVIIDYTDEEHYTVRYTEPEVMTGITYEYEDGKAYMSFGESRIPVTNGEACFASLAVARLLCPTKDDIVSITTDEKGAPTRAQGSIDGFEATLTEINITYQG